MTYFYNEQLPVGLLAQFVRAQHRYRRGQEFESGTSLNFFQAFLSASAKVIDLIHHTRHLCMRLWIDGILAMSRGFSGGKQWKKFVNTSNHGLICLFYQNETTI